MTANANSLIKTTVVRILLLLSVSLASADGYGRLVGQRTEVRDVQSDEEVQELGRFSVEEFNRQLHQLGNRAGDGGLLKFSKVVGAERQLVSGIKYYLKVEATDMNGNTTMFDSVVVVKPWLQWKKLLHFQASRESRVSK